MRRAVPIVVITLLVGGALAQPIRVMGQGGPDPAIVVRLLDEVIGADLAAL